MIQKDIEDYGGPFVDQLPVEDPTCEQSADLGNKALEDTAQLTRVPNLAVFAFTTRTTNGACTVTASKNIYATGTTTPPTVTRTATGTFAVSFGASFTNGLSETQTVSMAFSGARPTGNNPTYSALTTLPASNAFIVYTYASGVLSDLGGTATIVVTVQ